MSLVFYIILVFKNIKFRNYLYKRFYHLLKKNVYKMS